MRAVAHCEGFCSERLDWRRVLPASRREHGDPDELAELIAAGERLGGGWAFRVPTFVAPPWFFPVKGGCVRGLFGLSNDPCRVLFGGAAWV